MLCPYILVLHSSLNRANSSRLELNTHTSQPVYNRVYRIGTVCPTVFCVRQALTAASWIMETFGEIGANFLYNFHREHRLLKLVIKKLSPKINVKNIKE